MDCRVEVAGASKNVPSIFVTTTRAPSPAQSTTTFLLNRAELLSVSFPQATFPSWLLLFLPLFLPLRLPISQHHQSLPLIQVPSASKHPMPRGLDIQEWSLAQIISTAVLVGVVTSLTFCAAVAWLVPDLEEGGEERL